MSFPTWTPDALSAELRHYKGSCWRLVEAQHRVSTLKLVDSLDEQALLEDIIEETKPIIPLECQHLDYLLSTPFRYGAAYPHGSRFRRAGKTLGIYYAGETVQAAVAEMVFYRFLFYAESPHTPWPDNAAEYTAFSVDLLSKQSLDLNEPQLLRDAEHWTHPTSYGACQDLCDQARAVECGLIRYRSIRDLAGGSNLAVLSCSSFASLEPTERRTWRIRIGDSGAQALQEYPTLRMDFPTGCFDDPRLGALSHKR